jgi:pellino protein
MMGLEPSLYNDTNLSLFKPYAFRPCGHMASESTCKYWSKILVPQGTTQDLSSICPFCAHPLCKEQPFVKLIFQEGV